MIETQPTRPRHVGELDGLRGLLSLWVTVSHIVCWCGYADTKIPRPFDRVWREFVFAMPAVEAFIILSGFAISFQLHERRPSYRAFMTGRFFRIYPVYFACLLLGVVAVFCMPFLLETPSWRGTSYFETLRAISNQERSNLPAHLLAHLTLLFGLLPKAMLPDASATLLTPAWTITLEWQYYLVAPAIAWLVRSRSGLLGLALVAWFGLWFGGPWHNPLPAFLPAQLPLFLIGIGSYHLFAHQVSTRVDGSNSTLPSAILLALALVTPWHPTALAIWAIALGSVSARGTDLFARALQAVRGILGHPWLQRLGKVSYPLYLVHMPILMFCLFGLLKIWPTVAPIQATAVLTVISLPLILLAAILLHKLIEAPGMAIGKTIAKRARDDQKKTEVSTRE